MKKHTLKAFTSSFCVSLLVMSFISNFFVKPQNQSQSLEFVPSNNIALFLKNTPNKMAASPISQVKKISLNAIEQPLALELTKNTIPLEYGTVKTRKDVKIKKETAQLIESLPIDNIPITYEKKAIQKEKIIKDYADFIKKPANIAIEKLKTKKILYSENKEAITKQEKQAVASGHEKIKVPLIKDKDLIFGKDVKLSSTENSINMVAQNSDIQFSQSSTLNKEDKAEAKTEKKEDNTPWVEMKDKKSLPPVKEKTWSVATGTKHIKNQLMKPTKTEEKKAVSKNLLIPIPEEVSKEDISLPNITAKKNNLIEEAAEKSSELPITDDVKTKKTSQILKGLENLFSTKKTQQKTEAETQAEPKAKKPEKQKEVTAKKNPKKDILPSEIRLSFAPNRVEISGQALKWLTAFAQKAKEEKGVLEVRLDGASSVEIQQKRLTLISNIFASKGISKNQMKTIFTNREPNSFIIKIASDKDKSTNIENYYKYYQQ